MKQQISSTKGPKALGPYSAGIATEGLVFLSGQLGVNTEGNLVSEDVVEQTQKAFENIGVLLEALGLTYEDIVKRTVLLDDMNDFAKVNEEYAKYFDGIYPARSCFEVAALPKNAKVEIECIAIKKQFKHICRKQSLFFDVLKNFIVEKSMIYGSIYEREIGFEKGLFKSIFLRSQGGLYEQKFVIIHERSVS